MTHTPGPWIVERWIKSDETGWGIVAADGTKLLEIMRVKWQGTLANENISDDDMALILAAPDMLAALKLLAAIVDTMIADDPGSGLHEQVRQARAIIAKAEGGPQ
jgi:hypothetical protein